MAIEQVAPSPITKFGRALGRIDDVSEEHGHQGAVGLDCRPFSGEELLNFIDNGIRVADPPQVILAWKLGELGARNMLSEITALADVERAITGPMEDKGRHPNDRQDRPTSISLFIRKSVMTALGLAPRRRYLAHHWRNCGSSATEGAQVSIAIGFAPFPAPPSQPLLEIRLEPSRPKDSREPRSPWRCCHIG